MGWHCYFSLFLKARERYEVEDRSCGVCVFAGLEQVKFKVGTDQRVGGTT